MKIYFKVLEDISKFGPTVMNVNEFFMSWNSVMTLAYAGFTQTLIDIKSYLNNDKELALQNENPGARWTKTTLGCLRDGRQLTLEQVTRVRDLCTKFNKKLKAFKPKETEVRVTELSLVVFQLRTLEELWMEIPIPLRGTPYSLDSIPDDHMKNVQSTMNQFAPERLTEYYPRLAPEGRTIDTYYRCPHVEATLIAKAAWSQSVSKLVERLVWEMDSQEGVSTSYAWFRPENRHLTVRCLVPK